MDYEIFDIESLAWPPNGGKVKLVVLGLLVPAIIAGFAARSWIQQEAWLPTKTSGWYGVHGQDALATAAAYLSAAVFMHSRWCWGLLGFDRIFQAGTILALLAFVGSMIWVW